MARIDAFLKLGREQKCSDVHLSVGAPPMLRRLGELVPVKYRDLTDAEMQNLLYEILNPAQKREFESGNDLDFSYANEEVGAFRINMFRTMEGVCASFRVIANRIPSIDELGLPQVMSKLINVPNGLILVTGATGTGKSTTLASLIDYLNSNQKLNIITIEDPIEYIHPSKESLVIQREVGTHVTSFADGLRSALREDPDVILVGELRDTETIMMALMAAETGHLVLSTLHTASAAKTLDRMIDALPNEMKNQGMVSLAQSLRAVLSQVLVRKLDGQGRMAVHELMVMNKAIAHLVMTGKMHQIHSLIETSGELGMQTMDQALLAAINSKRLDPNDAYLFANEKPRFQRFVTDASLLPKVDLVGR